MFQREMTAFCHIITSTHTRQSIPIREHSCHYGSLWLYSSSDGNYHSPHRGARLRSVITVGVHVSILTANIIIILIDVNNNTNDFMIISIIAIVVTVIIILIIITVVVTVIIITVVVTVVVVIIVYIRTTP